MTYSILARTTISRVVEVEADSLDEARDKVESAFINGEMQFTHEDIDDCIETEQW